MRVAEAIFRGILRPFEVRKHPEATYPANHQEAMEVPLGGSNCDKCKFLSEDKQTCSSEDYIKWNNGSNKLLLPSNVFCSDWFVSKPGLLESEKKKEA